MLCYFALFGLVTLSYHAVQVANHEELFEAIQQYFICEAVGSGMECDRSVFNKFDNSGLAALVYLLTGLIPCVNLTFVINWTATKELCTHFWMKYYSKKTSTQASVATEQSRSSDTCMMETSIQ